MALRFPVRFVFLLMLVAAVLCVVLNLVLDATVYHVITVEADSRLNVFVTNQDGMPLGKLPVSLTMNEFAGFAKPGAGSNDPAWVTPKDFGVYATDDELEITYEDRIVRLHFYASEHDGAGRLKIYKTGGGPRSESVVVYLIDESSDSRRRPASTVPTDG